MKIEFSFVLKLALLTTLFVNAPSFAATHTKKRTTVKTEAPKSEPAPVAKSAPSPTPQSWSPSLSAGLGTLGSKFHFGVRGRTEKSIDFQGTPLRVGAELGFLLGPASPTSWAIPVEGLATYDFPSQGGIRGYLGLGLGLSIYHTGTYSIGNSTIDTSSTDVFFTGLLIPGIKLSDEYYAELPFGSMGGGFVLFPSIGMHF